MARISDAILNKDTVYAGKTPVVDLKYGGQNGYMPRIGTKIGDKTFEEWISNQAYVQRNIIPIVLRAPKFFNYMPDAQKWIDTYKALIELHPLAITGLTSGLTVETDEHNVGGAGEMQEEITDVKRARSSINITYKEKAGKSITKFFDYMIRYGMMDPDTKKPLVTKFNSDLLNTIEMYTADFYTGVILWVEPDITQQGVVDAWMSVNLFPKSNGDRTGKRDIKSAGDAPELSIDWASITINNEAVIEIAEKNLKKLGVLNNIPDVDLTAPLSEPDADVKASSVGFNET